MKIIKNLFAIMLVVMIAFSCKSEKKESDSTSEEVVVEEEVSDATEETQMEESSQTSDETTEATEDATEEATEEVVAQDKKITVVYPKDTKLENEVEKAILSLVKDNPDIKDHFNSSYGFAIFPVITKAGFVLGGAGGKGLVFEDKTVIGGSDMSQATFGLQAGGQQYQEVIFFENKVALDKFKGGKIKFSGQASAVAIKTGTSIDLKYQDGVAIFTKVKGGLMAEASAGGQKFKYKDGIEN
jgi:lipid-binding SYLF domain-containing protein